MLILLKLNKSVNVSRQYLPCFTLTRHKIILLHRIWCVFDVPVYTRCAWLLWVEESFDYVQEKTKRGRSTRNVLGLLMTE